MRVATMSMFFALLALGTNAAVLAVLGLRLAGRGDSRRRQALDAALEDAGLLFAFAVATVATLGSLYYSEIVGFEPCVLCWYQRIAMYPLPVILGVALLRGDRMVGRYAVPLACIGAVIAAYHYLIQWVPQLGGISNCSAEVPCTAAYVRVFGFISIPYMALSAFVLIAVVTAAVQRQAAILAAGEQSPATL